MSDKVIPFPGEWNAPKPREYKIDMSRVRRMKRINGKLVEVGLDGKTLPTPPKQRKVQP